VRTFCSAKEERGGVGDARTVLKARRVKRRYRMMSVLRLS
jgi:hypothetical protein